MTSTKTIVQNLWPNAALEAAIEGWGGRLAYYESIDSSNDEAKRLADAGAPEGTVVIAEAQTHGRGRAGRRWLTPAGQALAFSLLLRPRAVDGARLTMLGSLAVAQALEDELGLSPELKWPNDVLLFGKKVAGVLVDATWSGEHPVYAILGIGLNVRPESVPPSEDLLFPATCVDWHLGHPADRGGLLAAILGKLRSGYGQLDQVVGAWASRLAYKGKPVQVSGEGGDWNGILQDVDENGNLWLLTKTGDRHLVSSGDFNLRPVAD